MIALLLTAFAVIGLNIVSDATSADSASFAITTILMGFGFSLFVGESLERHIPDHRWAQVSLTRDASRRWGVKFFNAFLSKIGWNRLIFAMREEQAVGRGKDRNLRPIKAAAAGHAWAFLLHIATAVWASMSGGWVTSLTLLIVGIVGHLYPVLLQIYVLTKLRVTRDTQMPSADRPPK